MKIKSVVTIFLCVELICGQTSMSSTDWEFQQIDTNLREKENRVKALIVEVLAKVNMAIAELGLISKLTYVNKALPSVRDYLMSLSTVASYGNDVAVLSCDNLSLRISNIRFDIEKCVKIRVQLAVNATLLFVEAGKVKNAYVWDFATLTDAQRNLFGQSSHPY